MKKYKDLVKVLQEVSLDKFLKDKKVRKGIRRKSSWDLRDRHFGIEIELDPYQFDYEEDYATEVDEERARRDWEGSSEYYDDRPIDPSVWISDKFDEIYGNSSDPDNDVVVELWSEIQDWWNDNYIKYEDDELHDKWKINRSRWQDFWEAQLTKHIVSRKKYRKQYDSMLARKDKLKRNVQRVLDHPQKTFRFFEDSLKKEISELKKAKKEITANITRKYNDMINALRDYDTDSVWDDISDLDDVIQNRVEWLDTGAEDSFRNWLEHNMYEYIEGGGNDIDNAVDAASWMRHDLQIDWDFRPDGTPAVELVSPPLTSKDLGDLYNDLEVISHYDTDPGLSAHIHIEKGSNFDEFEMVAAVMLTDEDELAQDEFLGKGRESHLSQWARKMHGDLYDIEYHGQSGTEKSWSLKGGYRGIMLSKGTTGGKTVEFRYPSSTLLEDYEKIMANIQYFMAVVSIAKRKTVIRKVLKRGPLFNRVAYLVRDPSSNTGARYQIIDVIKKGKVQQYIDMSDFPQHKGTYIDYTTFDEPMKRALKKYGSLPAKMVREIQHIENNTRQLQDLIIRRDIETADEDLAGDIDRRRDAIRKNVRTMLRKQRRAR